jgi:hypothetical protein
MRSTDWDRQPWHLIPVKPGSCDVLGRVGITVISILAMLVLGLVAVAFVPQGGKNAPNHRQPSHFEVVHHS